MKYSFQILIFFTLCWPAFSTTFDFVVDQTGNGDFFTIQDALDFQPVFPYQRTIILIRKGIYHEKIHINRNYITLSGECKDSTIIEFSQVRSDWEKNRDFLGPAVVNIHADDIVLQDLTIRNTQSRNDIHAFAIYGTGSRIILENCIVTSKGGDTVSLWNYKTGMYYHRNCRFEGAVDFVCPRGWCYIRDSEFFEVRKTASLWHDGHFKQNQKFVIVHSYFDGVAGFHLGRHHYDAQFYFLNCCFSANLADSPIVWSLYDDPVKNNPNQWGNRIYFSNCSHPGGLFSWMTDNQVKSELITPAWTFENLWDPENPEPLKVNGIQFSESELILFFDEPVTVKGAPELTDSKGSCYPIILKRFLDISRLTFKIMEQSPVPEETFCVKIINGELLATQAYVDQKPLTEFTIRIE